MMDIHPGLIIWTIITFLILLAVLKRFAWKPILEALENRERSIKESIEEAQRARQEAQRLFEDYQQMMRVAHQDAQRIIVKAREEAERLREEILNEARGEAQAFQERARRQIEQETRAALMAIRAEVAEWVILAAERVIRRKLTPEDHNRISVEIAEELLTAPLNNLRS
ncbi:MAG: F0F1 ATP synthase subunit B [bacterium]